jgi:23S rRNA pseudouridine2605 synthase
VKVDARVRTAPAEITKLGETGTNAWFEVTLHEGRNQQIRRMFDAVGHSVLKLARVQIGPLRESKLKPGKWRRLTRDELKRFYSKKLDTRVKSKTGRGGLRVSAR